MDFETVVARRRMCREYSDMDVPSKVDRILELACRSTPRPGTLNRRSPSWCATNKRKRPWHGPR